MRRLFFIVLIFTCQAKAHWELNNEQSRLHFVTAKNNHIVEAHSFDMLSGTIKETQLAIEIPLSTVNTLIPIRNERIKSMLFNVSDFPIATFNASLSDTLLTLPAGTSMLSNVSGLIALHGNNVNAEFSVRITKITDKKLQVSTTQPYILNTTDFALTGGVDALKDIAGLKMISYAIPVTFNVIFEKLN